MSYSETVSYLYNLRKEGIKFGLDNTITLMSALENPHTSFFSLHVAGTNGKGSTAAIIASVLSSSGLKIGLFTSPHLVSFTERIRVNNDEIREDEVISLAEEIRGTISTIQSRFPDFSPTFFEVVTAMAMLYFNRKEIDTAVIEVGMGGRLDATNMITPEVSLITSIGNDHRQFLGETLREIAQEKAGIIKNNIPVVISPQDSEVVEVIESKAREKNTKVYLYGRDFCSILKRDDFSGIYFDYHSGSSAIYDLHVPLTGGHQLYNASVAIKAVELVSERRLKQVITANLIRDGLKNLRWPGRLEIIKDEPPILIDGAHNPDAALALSKALMKNFLRKFKRIILILGIMGDKDLEGIMRPLLPLAAEIILTSPDSERAASPARLASVAASLGFPDVRIAPTIKDAMEIAEGLSLIAPRDSLIVATGSFYSIGEVKEVIGQRGVLTRLRE
jgi:dihydrofolate synthase/folylpolyglutamate synthase